MVLENTVIADELLTKKLKWKMEKIYDEDLSVAINKPKKYCFTGK